MRFNFSINHFILKGN